MLKSITLQVTDVGKPLAALSKILDKGNILVFRRWKAGSYIRNDKTQEKTVIKEEKETVVIGSGEADFVRQG